MEPVSSALHTAVILARELKKRADALANEFPAAEALRTEADQTIIFVNRAKLMADQMNEKANVSTSPDVKSREAIFKGVLVVVQKAMVAFDEAEERLKTRTADSHKGKLIACFCYIWQMKGAPEHAEVLHSLVTKLAHERTKLTPLLVLDSHDATREQIATESAATRTAVLDQLEANLGSEKHHEAVEKGARAATRSTKQEVLAVREMVGQLIEQQKQAQAAAARSGWTANPVLGLRTVAINGDSTCFSPSAAPATTTSRYTNAVPCSSKVNAVNASDLHFKTDGSLDMRYKSSKEAIEEAHRLGVPPPRRSW